MNQNQIVEGALLWEPSDELKQESNLTHYMKWLKDTKGVEFKDYQDCWKWSVTNIEEFWESIWNYFKVKAHKPWQHILKNRKMPGTKWFEGAEINFAQQVFEKSHLNTPCMIFKSEISSLKEISWEELKQQVGALSLALKEMGVEPGDRVAAFMPNIPETVIAFLACASIGAIWSSCSPDFGAKSIIDRFKQIEPKVLFAVDGYRYGGKAFEKISIVKQLQNALDSLEITVLVPYLNHKAKLDRGNVRLWDDLIKKGADPFFHPVSFDFPLWVLYSSGTTGPPKAIVHSHGGILLELFKVLGFHVDLKPSTRFFWYTTTGWMMWNFLIGGLLLGSTIILYDGSPAYPDLNVLWDFAEKTKMNVFGTSAGYITTCMKQGLIPQKSYDLKDLISIGSTASPLPPEGFKWVYDNVKQDVWLASASGGTDVCTAFLGGCPLLPVYAGELQCRCLGVKAEAFDEAGNSIIDQVGELVITEPMPSMPIYFWNDPENKKYIESYFNVYPGVWRHGDWVKITQRGTAIIYGRSDSTLNRKGIRIGTAEIYRVVEDIEEVVDSLVVGLELEGGDYHIPLFVVLKNGLTLDNHLKKKINSKIRESFTPRHVPDNIIQVPAIPYTLNGKKMEVPVKKILMGFPLNRAVNLDALSNPDSINFFIELAKEFKDKFPLKKFS
ncbi:acetoacetate--CoA ligase [Desulfothermus naphthae]